MAGAFAMVANSGDIMYVLEPPSNRTRTGRPFIRTVTSMQRCMRALRWGCGPEPILYRARLLSTIGGLGGVGFDALAARESIRLRADVVIIRVAREYMGSESPSESKWYSPASSGSYCSLPESCSSGSGGVSSFGSP